MQLEKNLFGKNFHWGVATSAYQYEGAHDKDGKGNSIWDKFSEKKGRIYNNHHAQIACNFYECYDDDIELISFLNIPDFRFSLSWSRIISGGTGSVNMNGIDFYNKVIDKCLSRGIEPWVTLYHWDLPHALELKGGWTNREILNWFTAYVSVCVKHFGDRVKHWMVLNEPMVFTGAGYFLGVHAPGRKGANNFIPALHHAVLCQAQGGKILKDFNNSLQVGTTFSCSYITPQTNSERDKNAAIRIDALLNRLFIEPALGLGYPITDLKFLNRIEKYYHSNDDKLMQFDFDFIGIQNYTREVAAYSFFTPYLQAKLIPADKRNVQRTVMNWEIYPESIYKMIEKFSAYKNVKKIIVTENGAAFPDHVVDGVITDTDRVKFLQAYLSSVLKAKQDGHKIDGYFIWSFTDNFEWAEGYVPRFGIVYIDFETQKRIVKQSGEWYKEFLK
ncbi:MAG: GH1 family beta-glucosidase [Bacteroidia bacterium]